MTENNGAAPSSAAPRRPRYGDREWQDMHPDEADEFLRLLYEREPMVFARLRVEQMTGDKYTVSRKRADS